ncbi:unnamed protein product [Danaus chrysippus]|uniref:(African queen) hypothetical protein n=1 Tax=Danaus chrysippus TaxID=151541 RepID=A0A8J2Q1W1_9NEOP|nr:unnamed protein product [Danaus chrysippus]
MCFCISYLSRVDNTRTKESNKRVESRTAFHLRLASVIFTNTAEAVNLNSIAPQEPVEGKGRVRNANVSVQKRRLKAEASRQAVVAVLAS